MWLEVRKIWRETSRGSKWSRKVFGAYLHLSQKIACIWMGIDEVPSGRPFAQWAHQISMPCLDEGKMSRIIGWIQQLEVQISLSNAPGGMRCLKLPHQLYQIGGLMEQVWRCLFISGHLPPISNRYWKNRPSYYHFNIAECRSSTGTECFEQDKNIRCGKKRKRWVPDIEVRLAPINQVIKRHWRHHSFLLYSVG